MERKTSEGGCFSQISQENFPHKFEYLPMLKNTTDSLSKVRTNIREQKSIILDSFHEDFLVEKNFWRGVFFSDFSDDIKNVIDFIFFCKL